MSEFITRFAPSPTGLLHLGHGFSALTAYRAAMENKGRFILRIEDIDQTRCHLEYEQAIYDDLAWLGVQWETPVRRQSDHFDEYTAALEKLRAQNLVYRCFKTRKEVADVIASAPHFSVNGPKGPQFIGAPLPPDEETRLLETGAPFAWRLSLDAARNHLGAAFNDLSFLEEGAGPNGETGVMPARPQIFGDPVIARKDAGTSYHLACVHDDGLQQITHVIRGEDLFCATHLHRLLQALFDIPAPIYRHHRLLTDESGKRFAKRDRSKTLQALRTEGLSREDILAAMNF